MRAKSATAMSSKSFAIDVERQVYGHVHRPQTHDLEPLRTIPRSSRTAIGGMDTAPEEPIPEGRERDIATTLVDDPKVVASLVRAEHAFSRGDTCAAINILNKLLEQEQGIVPACIRLDEIYRARGQWTDVARIGLVRAEHTPILEEQLRLLGEVARVYECELRDPATALVVIEAAFIRDIANAHTARALARLATIFRDWPSMLSQYHEQAAELESSRKDDAAKLWNQIAAWYADLGEVEQADYARSRKTRLDQLRVSDDALDVAVTLQAPSYVSGAGAGWGSAPIAATMPNTKRPVKPKHFSADATDWHAVIAAKRSRLEDADLYGHAHILSEIATIYQGHLKAPEKAAEAIRDALVFKPKDRALLQRLQDLYAELEQWENVVATIKQFVELEQLPARRGAYHFCAATVYRDALGEIDPALTHYRLAFDALLNSPTTLNDQTFSQMVAAFDAADCIVASRGDWQAQKASYLATLERLADPSFDSPEFRAFRIRLLDGLAAIYRTRFQLVPAAVEVLEIAARLDASADRQIQLGDLCVRAGVHNAEKAAAHYLAALNTDPLRTDCYRALHKLYAETQQLDKLWCLCRATVFLGIAGARRARAFQTAQATRNASREEAAERCGMGPLRRTAERRGHRGSRPVTWS